MVECLFCQFKTPGTAPEPPRCMLFRPQAEDEYALSLDMFCTFTYLHPWQTGRERLDGAPGPSNGNAGRVAGELVPTDDGSGSAPPRGGNSDGGRGDGDG